MHIGFVLPVDVPLGLRVMTSPTHHEKKKQMETLMPGSTRLRTRAAARASALDAWPGRLMQGSARLM